MSFWRKVAERPQGVRLFELLRKIDAEQAQRPRQGTSTRPQEDGVRLGQAPSLGFAPVELDSVDADGAVPQVKVRSLGLFGPNGALPLHMTEYVWDRLHNHRDPTWANFADIFHHRMLGLFYRAWAEAEPAVAYDRPAQDSYADYLGALCGYGADSLRQRDSVADEAKLHFAGLLSRSNRDADSLSRILADYFQVPVNILPFTRHWLTLPVSQRSQLGRAGGLGQGVVLGSRVPDRQSCFTITLGPMPYAEYVRFLPGSAALKRLHDWIANYVGLSLQWQLRLLVDPATVPAPRLTGQVQLGRDVWLGRPVADQPAEGWRQPCTA